MTENQTTITIDRATWRCGEDGGWGDTRTCHGKGQTFLRNSEGYKCCLGFAAEQLSEEAASLLDDSTGYVNPSCLQVDIPYLIERSNEHRYGWSGLTARAVSINDNPTTLLIEKEQMLTELFACLGLTLKFEGEYEPING